MGWIDLLKGKVVGFDTMPLIYYMEEHPIYLDIVDPFFDAIENGEFTVVTSTITLLEVLVHPIRNGDTKLAQKYRDLLVQPGGFIKMVPLSKEIAEEAARLRATSKIQTPDSIQMATAIKSSASFFLTNDKQLPSLPNLRMLKLNELAKEDQE